MLSSYTKLMTRLSFAIIMMITQYSTSVVDLMIYVLLLEILIYQVCSKKHNICQYRYSIIVSLIKIIKSIKMM